MINNTDTFLLLSHKKKLSLKSKFPKYLSFTDSDVAKLYSTEKRQVFIKMGNSSNVYNLVIKVITRNRKDIIMCKGNEKVSAIT